MIRRLDGLTVEILRAPRWLRAVWCFAMLAVLVGCRGKPPGAATGLLVADADPSDAARATWDAAIAAFKEKHPDAAVEVQRFKDDDYTSYALPSLMRSRRPPDVYFAWPGYAVARDARAGLAADLTEALTGDWSDRLDPRAWEGTEHQGRRYLLPVSIDLSNVLWCRRSILARHGLSPPATWAELVATCKKLKAANQQPFVHGNKAGWPAGNWAAHLVEQYAGIDDYRRAGLPGGAVRLDHPAFVRALERLQELAAAGAFNADINTLDDQEGVARFAAGGGAFHFNGLWASRDLDRHEDLGLIGELALPDRPGGKRSILATSSGYMVHAASARREQALDLLQAFMSPSVQKGVVERGTFSALKDVAADVQPGSLVGQAARILAGADYFVAAPDISWNPQIADRFYQAVKEVVGGTSTAQQALTAAARDVEKVR